jgi:hypothetical protein
MLKQQAGLTRLPTPPLLDPSSIAGPPRVSVHQPSLHMAGAPGGCPPGGAGGRYRAVQSADAVRRKHYGGAVTDYDILEAQLQSGNLYSACFLVREVCAIHSLRGHKL